MVKHFKGDLMTREEVQDFLKMSGVTLSKLTRAGRLTYYKAGRRILFDREELLNEIRKGKTV